VTRIDAEASVEEGLAALRRGAPEAVRTVKRLAREHQAKDLDRVVADLAAVSAELFEGAEAREGMAAFAERCRPAWALA
jgi:enoyl-CoA hydratase/carnithine racemase